MSIQSVYRGTPAYLAVPLAVLASAVGAFTLSALAVFAVDFLLKHYDGPDGPGAGVLLILVALNIAVPTFITVVSILVNLHHGASWLTLTLAFTFCSVIVGVWAPFRMDVEDLLFLPLVLGTGAVTCLVSCWLLRRKLSSHSRHVIEA